MLSDLQLREFRGSERANGDDQELLVQYQDEFFSTAAGDDTVTKQGKKRKRRKVAKCPWAVTGQRNAAALHIKALDHQLFVTTGYGLLYYATTVGASIALAYLYHNTIPRTLVLHLDEGSPAYSMTWFLVFSCRLRMIPIRDIHHRIWNDIKNSINDAGLWHIILLTTVVFNMPFGPWDGGAWFVKMKEQSEEMMQSLSPSNPLFDALYELICIDLCIEADGSVEHKAMIFRMVFAGDAFKVKGSKVSLRRWFSWFAAAHLYLPLWHQRLMALIGIGQTTKVYKGFKDVPLWSSVTTRAGNVGDAEADGGPSSDSEDDGENDAPAAAPAPGGGDEVPIVRGEEQGDAQAAAAAVQAAGAKHAEASEEHGPVKDKLSASRELKALRATCKNTLFVAASVLSKEGVRNQVALILELLRPIWTEHAGQARDCRDPAGTLGFYVGQARCQYMRSLGQSASVMVTLPTLKAIGFTTDFSKGLPRGIKVTSDVVCVQNELAQTMVDVFLNACFHREGSMLYHSHSWPGQAALGADHTPLEHEELLMQDDNDPYETFLRNLRRDYRIYLEVLWMHSDNSTFLLKLIKASPFKMPFMVDLAELCTLPAPGLTNVDIKRKVHEYLHRIFSSWGQTKVVEDLFKKMRERESQDTLNGIRAVYSYFAAASQMGAIKLHHRNEVEFDLEGKLAHGSATSLFSCKKWQPTMENWQKITEKADWPTFSPQSAKNISGDLILLRHLDDRQCWGSASACWQAELLHRGILFHYKPKHLPVEQYCYLVSLGPLWHEVVLTWKVQDSLIPNTNHKVFRFTGRSVDNRAPTPICVLDLDEFSVVPQTPVSPIHLVLALNKKITRDIQLGVVLLQYDQEQPIMLWCARHAFFDLGLPQLKTIVSEYGIDHQPVTLPATLTACCKHFIKEHTGKDATDAELHAILALRSVEQDDYIPGFSDEDLLVEILEKEEADAFEADMLDNI